MKLIDEGENMKTKNRKGKLSHKGLKYNWKLESIEKYLAPNVAKIRQRKKIKKEEEKYENKYSDYLMY